MKKKVVIVGQGVAALSAAIYSARFGHDVTVLEGANGSQLLETPLIENFPGFPNGISGYDLISEMSLQAEKFGAKLSEVCQVLKIISIDYENKIVNYDKDGSPTSIKYDALIFATGVTHKKLENVQGMEKASGHIHYCALCDGAFYEGKSVAVIGGGDTALTEALVLSNICKAVYVVHRRDQFRASQYVVDKLSKKRNVNLLCPFVLNSIKTDESGDIEKIVLEHNDEDHDLVDFVDIDGIFVAIGNTKNTELFDGTIFVRKDNGVFFCGDCVSESKYRQAIIAAGEGAKTAIDANEYLSNALEV